MSIDMNSIIKINGKSMNMPEFAERFGLDLLNPALVITTANILIKQGKVTVVDTATKEQKIMNNAMEQEEFQAVVNGINAQEEAHKQRVRNQKLQETDNHSFALNFVTGVEATKFKVWVDSLGIQNTKLTQDLSTGAIKLEIREVTPNEYVKITNKYKADTAINKGMQTANQVVTGATNVVNYGMTNMIAPTAKIAGEASVNLAKGIFHTGLRTIAGLVNSTAKAVVDNKIAIATDPECLRAASTLMDTKNTVKRTVAEKMNNTNFGNGIEML
jgi:ribosomal protein S13